MTDQAVDLIEKRCPDCGEVKPLSQFYRNGARGDGRHAYCARCQKARTVAYQERKRAEDPEAFRLKRLQSVDRHRRRTNNERGKALNRARTEAIRRLIAAHERQFDAIYRLVRAEHGLLKEDQ